MSDEGLLTGLRSGDTAALSAFIDVYLPAVYALCGRVLAGVGSPQDIEECVSDAFHAAWHQANRFDPARAPLRTWLLMLAKYVALERRRNLVRKARLEVAGQALDDLPTDAPSPDECLASAAERERLQAALCALPVLDRALIYRKHFLGESTQSLATAFGLSTQAVDNRLWRTRRRLRSLLDGEGQKEVRPREST